jgi:hypothetical protein
MVRVSVKRVLQSGTTSTLCLTEQNCTKKYRAFQKMVIKQLLQIQPKGENDKGK